MSDVLAVAAGEAVRAVALVAGPVVDASGAVQAERRIRAGNRRRRSPDRTGS